MTRLVRWFRVRRITRVQMVDAAGVLIGWAEQEDGAIYNVRGCGPVYG